MASYPYRVDVYRRKTTGASEHREQQRVLDPISFDVECDIQLQAGSVGQEGHGRDIRREYDVYFPSGSDVRPDDRLLVVEGVGPTVSKRLRVTSAFDWGDPGGVDGEAVENQEDFG